MGAVEAVEAFVFGEATASGSGGGAGGGIRTASSVISPISVIIINSLPAC